MSVLSADCENWRSQVHHALSKPQSPHVRQTFARAPRRCQCLLHVVDPSCAFRFRNTDLHDRAISGMPAYHPLAIAQGWDPAKVDAGILADIKAVLKAGYNVLGE